MKNQKSHLLAVCLGNQGAIWLEKANFEKAQKYFAEEELLLKKLGDVVGQCINQGNQGIIKFNKGNAFSEEGPNRLRKQFFKAAGVLFQNQERLARMVGFLPGLANAMTNNGILLYQKGKILKAKKRFDDAEKIFRDMGASQSLQNVLGRQALIQMDLADYDRALMFLEEREKINKATQQVPGLINTYIQYMELYVNKLNSPQFAYNNYYLENKELIDSYGTKKQLQKIDSLFGALNY